MPEQEISFYDVRHHLAQFVLQYTQLDGWSHATTEIRYLAIHASPVACIVRVQIHSYGQAARTPRENCVHVLVPEPRSVVILRGKDECIRHRLHL